MRKEILFISAFVAIAANSFAADYLFPSSNPPAGKSPADINQYVVISWDDNSYSGKKGTQYEASPAATYAASSWVGGIINEGGWIMKKPDTLHISEGDMGVTWAAVKLAGHVPIKYLKWDSTATYTQYKDTVIYHDSIWYAFNWVNTGLKPQIYPANTPSYEQWWKLAGPVNKTLTRKNPDGTPLHFSFNVITGLLVPVWPVDWTQRVSKLGYYVPTAFDYPDGVILHTKIAVAWGREQQILEAQAGKQFQEGYLQESVAEAIALGHEIGNHTIDHLESNSPLPNNSLGFGRWGGEGFDKYPNDTMPWGEVFDEAKHFGQKVGASAQTMGWKMFAGRYISRTAWKGLAQLAEEQLDQYLGVSVAKGNCWGFRAPRLEGNGEMFYGLKSAGYQYDCGVEEGYDPGITAANELWPYTTDNGSPSTAYDKSSGERTFYDSMPGGVWELPSDAIVVPPEIRQAVYANYALIAKNSPEGDAVETYDAWVANGAKISAYDFNVWILWGMTLDNWKKTMQYNLDQRLANNKAPLHFAAHPDYYTPIYDNATLLNSLNKTSYGLNVTNKWNTWADRIAGMEWFVDYALSKGCYFLSAHEMIEELKKMQAAEAFGTATAVTDAAWTFFKNTAVVSTATTPSFTGTITAASVTVGAAVGAEYPQAGYAMTKPAGYFSGLDHLELTYMTTAPLILRLIVAGDDPWEVTLNNLGPEVKSGKIPVLAFHYSYEGTPGKNKAPNPANITGIQVELVTSGDKQETHTLTIKDLKLYKGAAQAVAGNTRGLQLEKDVSVRSLTRSGLSLFAGHSGTYSISLLTPDGKKVASSENVRLNVGANTVRMGVVSRGVYLVTVKNGSAKITVRHVVM
jgi:hypothetical protein